MKYAVLHGFDLISVVEAVDIARAIEVKLALQRAYNRRHNIDDAVFHVRAATAQEVEAVNEDTAGFVVLKKSS